VPALIPRSIRSFDGITTCPLALAFEIFGFIPSPDPHILRRKLALLAPSVGFAGAGTLAKVRRNFRVDVYFTRDVEDLGLWDAIFAPFRVHQGFCQKRATAA
jgi:hypothetical protein